jgi:hypothetical protein
MEKKRLVLMYFKFVTACVAIVLSVIVILNSINRMSSFDYDGIDEIKECQHCVITQIGKSIRSDGVIVYYADVRFDSGETSRLRIDKFDFMHRHIGDDAIAINKTYLQKEGSKI